VYIPYCTGDVHSGTRNTKDPYWNTFYFSGYLNVQAVLDDINDKYGFNKATQVLLSGTSAGGIGTFVNADTVGQRVPSAHYKALPQGGWFFPNVTNYTYWQQGVYVDPVTYNTTYLWGQYIAPNCAAAETNLLACCSIDTSYKYIKTSLYVVENMYDTNQIFTQLGCPQHAKDTPDYETYFGTAMKLSTNQVPASPKKTDGLFLMSCLDHTENTYISSPTKVGGYVQQTSILDWYFDGSSVPHVLVDSCSGVACNPTC